MNSLYDQKPRITDIFSRLLWLILPLVLVACSEGNDEADLRLDSQSYAYNNEGAYASVLKDCVLTGTVSDSCTLETLPFIGQEGSSDISAIMDRVLVTHSWMGLRFEEMLHQLPDDLLPLFGSTTAIFIGSYLRPSYYSTLNGAIHIDPNFLWLTRQEKATISQQRDPRQDFGAELQFDAFRRFVRDQNNAWESYSLSDSSEREHQDILLSLARVLYHELSHANDFMPHSELSGLDSSLRVIDAIDSVRENWVYRTLVANQPLNSDFLKSLARVRYRNNPPSEEEKSAEAEYVGALMQNDGANYFYGYYTDREDLAGLFEAVMMKLNFDVDMDFAFVTNPGGASPRCSEYVVGWGVRGRLGDPLVASRARLVVNRILSDTQRVESMLNEQALMTQQYMRPGDDWCSNLILDDVSVGASQKAHEKTSDTMILRESNGLLD